MAGVQRIAIVDPADKSREDLRNCLLGVESIWLEAECSRYEFFVDVIKQAQPDAVIIALDSEPDQAIQLMHTVTTTYPDIDVIAVSARTDGQFILQVMRNGAKEFVGLPVQLEEILGAVDRLRASRAGRDGETLLPSKVYSFVGARGGVGSTSLAINFGCILAQNSANSVAIIDLDLAMGDADVCLDLIPDYTMADVALSIDRIDLQLLKRSLSKHSSGLYLLPHPVQIEDAGLIQADHVSRVLSLMRMSFSHIILDLSKAFGQMDFAAMQLSDEIVLVTQLDVSNLRNVVRLMLTLSEREGMADRVRVVANRVGSDDNEISIQRAEETIGRPVFSRIPNDSRTMMASRNSGVPLLEYAPKTKLYQAVLSMTQLMTSPDSHEPKPKEKKGFFFFSGHD